MPFNMEESQETHKATTAYSLTGQPNPCNLLMVSIYNMITVSIDQLIATAAGAGPNPWSKTSVARYLDWSQGPLSHRVPILYGQQQTWGQFNSGIGIDGQFWNCLFEKIIEWGTFCTLHLKLIVAFY